MKISTEEIHKADGTITKWAKLGLLSSLLFLVVGWRS